MNYVTYLVSFASTAALVVAMPGLDTALVLRTATAGGRRAGIAVAIGIGIGCLCWGVAVTLGLGALIRTWPVAIHVLKLTGAIFLFWLGVQLLRKERPGSTSTPSGDDDTPSQTVIHSFGKGFVGNILNPKVGLFYVTLLPQFVPTAAPVATFSFLLTLIHVAIAIVWFMVLATSAATLAPVLRRPSVSRGLDLVTGFVFLGFSAQLVLFAV